MWSEGATSISASGSSRKVSAAVRIAGAVSRPSGSRMIVVSSRPIVSACSRTRNRNDSPVTMTGRSNSGRAKRLRVVWNRLSEPTRGMNCLGNAFREEGHRRVPDPPQSMTG